ncbi:MAG: SDR family NAD(P)-dependent oxidoreductase [Paludibaculum sp.]
MQLTGRVILITGAKGGLGNDVTGRFLAAGAQVAGVSRSIQDADFENPSFRAFPAELSNAAKAAALVNGVYAHYGRVDAVVHLLGGYVGGHSVADTPDAVFEQMFDLNLRSFFYLSRAVLPRMREQKSGRLLAIGSRAAVEPVATAAAYSASKAALVSLVKAIALENQDAGITANVILPGAIDTPANRAAMPDADHTKWVSPGQIANLLVHVAGDGLSQLSGAVIPFYGAAL